MKRIIRFQLCPPAHRHFVCNIIENITLLNKIRKTSYLMRLINLGRYPHRCLTASTYIQIHFTIAHSCTGSFKQYILNHTVHNHNNNHLIVKSLIIIHVFVYYRLSEIFRHDCADAMMCRIILGVTW